MDEVFNWTLLPFNADDYVRKTQSITDFTIAQPPLGVDRAVLNIKFNPGNFSNGELLKNYNDTYWESIFTAYLWWLEPSDIIQEFPKSYSKPYSLYCDTPDLACSTLEDCTPLYNSLDDWLKNVDPSLFSYTPPSEYVTIHIFLDGLLGPDANFDPSRMTLTCPLILRNRSQDDDQTRSCQQPEQKMWSAAGSEIDVDQDIDIFVHGGVTSDGSLHRPLGDAPFSARLREMFLGGVPGNCTLESVCPMPLDCDQVGWRLTQHGAKPRVRSQWAYYTLTSVANINQQFFNQFEALQSATIEDSLAAFNIDDYYPKPGKHLALKNILTGLSTVLAAVSGFIPFIGEIAVFAVLGATAGSLGAIASGAGTYFERSLATNVDASDPNIAQKRFAPIVRQVFRVFSESLDNITTDLFRGQRIGGSFDVYDMMKKGVWVDQNRLSRIAAVQAQLFNEITSRAIDSLWKTPAHNKMWVLFVDLNDDNKQGKCKNDTSGPSKLKYCGDGGVYYAYNFVEKGNLVGHRDYPWGSDKMKENLGIDPSVSLGPNYIFSLILRPSSGYETNRFGSG